MNFLKTHILSILIFSIYLLEGVSKYYLTIHSVQIRASRYIKLVILIIVVLYILYKKRYKVFFIPFLLVLFFVIGHYMMSFEFISFETMVVFTKYIFPIIIIESSFVYIKERDSSNLFKTYELIVFLNSIVVIVGFLLDTQLFKTYSGSRFGYNGLLITSATGTYFYIIAIYYLYLKKNSSINWLLFFLLVLASSLLVGTKSIYLFLMFLFSYDMFIRYKETNILSKILFSFFFIVLITSLFLFLEPSFINMEKDHGLLTTFLSYRDQLFIQKTLPFINENWHFVNYIVGGQGEIDARTQLGFIDLFFFFGILGAIMYVYAFCKSFIKFSLNINTIFILVSLLIIVSLAGNFFYSTSVTIYLILLQRKLLTYEN